MIHPTDTPATFSAVPGHTRLFRRDGGTYYLRAKIPAALRPIIRKTEERISLRTKVLKEALTKVKIESLRVDREFAEAEARLKGMNPPQRKLSGEEVAWIFADFFVKADRDLMTWTEKAQEELPPNEINCIADDLIVDAIALDSFSKDSHPHESDDGARFLDAYLRGEGKRWGILRDSEDYKLLLRKFRQGQVEISNRSIDKLLGKHGRGKQFAEFSPHTILPPPPHQNILLGKYLIEFMEYQKSAHAQNTPASYKLPVRVLKDVLGKHTPLASITRQDIEKVCETLKQVPVNMTQRYRGLSVEKAIQAAERLRDDRRISPRTMKNYYTLIVAIFNYAIDEGYIKENPARSRKLRGLFKEERRTAKRALFTPEELKAIFHAPLYTGCIDDMRGYNKEGPNHPKRGKYWVPLLALFHGLRSNEACQLYTEDIGQEGEIPYLNIREDLDEERKTEKRIKNFASWRKIPLHPEILKMGFLEYVEERKKDPSSLRLFPTLAISKNTARYSHVFGKWFRYFLMAACGYRPKATFHSFRHHFRTALMNAGVSRELAEALGGWSPVGSSETEYRHSQLPTLLEAISKVEYPGLDLSHLYIQQEK